jgi:hypothetical protein
VSGNVPLELATRNALYTAELCGSDVTDGVIRELDGTRWKAPLYLLLSR